MAEQSQDKSQLITEIKKDLSELCNGLRELREFEQEFRQRAYKVEKHLLQVIWNIRGVFEMHEQKEFVKMLEEIKKGGE